jgi:RHS repeat-associated protein
MIAITGWSVEEKSGETSGQDPPYDLALFIARRRGAGDVSWFLTNHVGSNVATTDALGNEIENSRFTPYGERHAKLLERGPAYAGHFEDATGITYMKARYYSGFMGVFLAIDPVDVDSMTQQIAASTARAPPESCKGPRNTEVLADLACEMVVDLRVPRDGAARVQRLVLLPGVPSSLAEQGTSVALQVGQQISPPHTAIGSSSYPLPAAFLASSRLNSIASDSVARSVSMSASRVGSWQLTPGTSSIHPIHHSPDCFTTAV